MGAHSSGGQNRPSQKGPPLSQRLSDALAFVQPFCSSPRELILLLLGLPCKRRLRARAACAPEGGSPRTCWGRVRDNSLPPFLCGGDDFQESGFPFASPKTPGPTFQPAIPTPHGFTHAFIQNTTKAIKPLLLIMHFSGLTGDTHHSLADPQPGSHCSAMPRCPLHLEEPWRSSVCPARSSQPCGFAMGSFMQCFMPQMCHSPPLRQRFLPLLSLASSRRW